MEDVLLAQPGQRQRPGQKELVHLMASKIGVSGRVACSQSSVVSSTTTDKLAVTIAKVTDGFKTVQDITVELQSAIREEKGGPWPGFPHLTQDLLEESLEGLKDPHRELLLRAETRVRDFERATDLGEEDLDYNTRRNTSGAH